MATTPLSVQHTIGSRATLCQSSRSLYALIHTCTRRKRERARRFVVPSNEAKEPAAAEFSIDKDKAREALGNLDKQLQALSQKQMVAPKKKSSDLSSSATATPASPSDSDMDARAKEMPEVSQSFLAYSAVALLVVTLINNMIFILFIKPSVDGDQQLASVMATPITGEVVDSNFVAQAPPLTGVD